MFAIARVLQNLLRRYLKVPLRETFYTDDQKPISQQSEPTSISPENILRPFEDLPSSYNPSTCWLDDQLPRRPYFGDDEQIRLHVKDIKGALFQCILEGCRIVLEKTNNHELLNSITQYEVLWRAAISVHKYGVLYLAARSECREEFLPAIESNRQLFTQIDILLSCNDNCNRAINYGVHRLVNSSILTVDYQKRLIPPTAISAIGVRHIAVRRKDFDGDSLCMLDYPSAIWDLHDFAHLSAASVCPSLYGSKYFTDLIKLPPKLTALIRSPKMHTEEPSPLYSDGLIFSELLTVLFTSEIEAAQKGGNAAYL